MAARSGTQHPVGPPDRDYLRPSAIQWAKVTDDLDQVDLALTMTTLREELDPDWADAPRTRARLLLLGDRPAEALTVLRAAGLSPTSSPGPLSGPELLVVAVYAANGDDDCYFRLREALRLVGGNTQRWSISYLLASAARARGESDVADRIWIDLVDGLGIVTALTLTRSAAARVARRRHGGPGSGAHAAEQVVETVLNFETLSHSPVDDPGPVIGAAEQLRAQGDPGGARLLLWATHRIHGPVPAVQAALAALTPTQAMQRHRLRAAFALFLPVLLVVALIPFGLLIPSVPAALLLMLFGRAYWIRRVAVPGLSVPDSRAWRRIGALPPGPDPNSPSRDQPDDDQPCRCRHTTVLTGAVARAYGDGHLRPPTAFTASDPVRAILGPDAGLMVCPATQIVWLGVDLHSDRPGYAFRGAEPVIETNAVASAEELIGERGGPA